MTSWFTFSSCNASPELWQHYLLYYIFFQRGTIISSQVVSLLGRFAHDASNTRGDQFDCLQSGETDSFPASSLLFVFQEEMRHLHQGFAFLEKLLKDLHCFFIQSCWGGSTAARPSAPALCRPTKATALAWPWSSSNQFSCHIKTCIDEFM